MFHKTWLMWLICHNMFYRAWLIWLMCLKLTLSLITSTFSFSLGTTALGGSPFSSCITDFTYFMVVPFMASGSRVSNPTFKNNNQSIKKAGVVSVKGANEVNEFFEKNEQKVLQGEELTISGVN